MLSEPPPIQGVRSHPHPRVSVIRRIVETFLRRVLTTVVVLTVSACVGPRTISMEAASDSTVTPPMGWAAAGGAATPRPPASGTQADPGRRNDTRISPPVRQASVGNDEASIDDGAVAETRPAERAPTYAECVAPLDATEPLYVLPYAVGEAYDVRQGTCGPVTHRRAFSYSYDFDMVPGTPILAARGGIVASVVEGHPENTNRSSHANYLVIRHEDGQYSRYLHLQREGVLVAEGDTVLTGDLVAYSGNSGRSSKPHLHFDVTGGCGRVSSRCPTLPTTFMNSEEKAPRGGQRVVALPY